MIIREYVVCSVMYDISFFVFLALSFFATDDLKDQVLVLVQTSIRDYNGNLVAYMESAKYYKINDDLDQFLDYEAAKADDPVIDINGTKYELIKRMQTYTFDAANIISSTSLVNNIDGRLAVYANFSHDGYQVISGDRLESLWTFVRPA